MVARGSHQLSRNKFFDPSTPSMRKGCDEEEKKKKERKDKSTSRLNDNRLQHRRMLYHDITLICYLCYNLQDYAISCQIMLNCKCYAILCLP